MKYKIIKIDVSLNPPDYTVIEEQLDLSIALNKLSNLLNTNSELNISYVSRPQTWKPPTH